MMTLLVFPAVKTRKAATADKVIEAIGYLKAEM